MMDGHLTSRLQLFSPLFSLVGARQFSSVKVGFAEEFWKGWRLGAAKMSRFFPGLGVFSCPKADERMEIFPPPEATARGGRGGGESVIVEEL